jgi:hypothetical protein
MTSGLRSSADVGARPKKRLRASAIAARSPRTTATTLESAATFALVTIEPLSSGLAAKSS